MKFRTLAVDYDGTIAANGELDRDAAAAIQQARSVGTLVALVTGRILSDLEALVDGPSLFDAIVGENGAVIWLPMKGTTITLGRAPAPEFLQELAHLGIRHRSGASVVEAAAADAPRIIETIRAIGLPLAISFNRDRLMVLPQGISKAGGLQEALRRLRASVHNAIAIGDGENDHDLLEVCEIGAAVEWGSESLKRSADEVVSGEGPAAVADYIRGLLAMGRIPPERLGRRWVRLGTRADGESVDFGIRGRNVLIGGDPKSGKSWITGLLCEQLVLKRYSVCILDPEGDYVCLEALPGVIVHTVSGEEAPLSEIEHILSHPELSLVLDMSAAPRGAKPRLVRQLLEGINQVRRTTGLPHRVVVDEAHYFLARLDDPDLFDRALGGYLLVTYRISDLSREVLAASEAVIVTRVANRAQALALRELVPAAGTESDWLASLANLAVDEALLLPGSRESGEGLVRFQIAPRLTNHVRHREKYVEVPVRPGQEFVFTHDGRPTGERARSLAEFESHLSALPEDAFQDHLRRGDFSRWIGQVFGDRELSRAIRRNERGDTATARRSIRDEIQARYFSKPHPPHR